MNKKKFLLTTISTLFILGLLVIYNFYNKIYAPNITKDTILFITSNSDFDDISNKLSPYLKNKKSFIWVAKKKNYPNLIKAGKYKLSEGLNNNDLINKLRSGTQTPIKLSFNNQDSLEKLAGRIATQIEPDSITLLNTFKNKEFLNANDFNIQTALGMYIPNSYEFYWNTSAANFQKKMLKEYNSFWNDARKAKATKQHLTINQVITLASIVQKETANVNERPRVAGLYLNRLNNNWPLQADPTIIFAIKEKFGQDKVVKRVLNKDLEINSNYNTYKNTGLPPGPIAMPDISSINAVLNPENHDYFYMCADINSLNKHVFAKTLAQHNRNAKKYQEWLNKQGVNR